MVSKMKFAIVSDSHGNTANFKKAVGFLNNEGIKTILHCGDIGSPESLKESLEDFEGNIFGVLGNMDRDYKILIEEYNRIPGAKIEEHILTTEVFGKKIAITHYPEDARELAESGKYDLVFYGHTHKPWEEKVASCRLINPGEIAGQRFKPSFAVYDAEKDFLELKILEKL